jgi:hypothetical protein
MEDNIMIFLSHNFKDKAVVEQVALKLRAIYGQNNVFYDSWSIQPGEGIIDKMEEGLNNCKFFFFFVSNNSLKSNMVKMEWQNAIFKAAQNTIKFIPVKMDNCNIPFLLTQSLYIDLFANGLDVAIRQIVDVINGTNTYRTLNSEFHNLVAIKQRIGNKIIIECVAKYYLEPISHFGFCTQTDLKKVRARITSDAAEITSTQNNAKFQNGYTTNIFFRGVSRGTLPGFSVIAEFSHIEDEPFDIEIVLHEKRHGYYEPIPIEIKQ